MGTLRFAHPAMLSLRDHGVARDSTLAEHAGQFGKTGGVLFYPLPGGLITGESPTLGA